MTAHPWPLLRRHLEGVPDGGDILDPGAADRGELPWYRHAFEEAYLKVYNHRDQEEARRAVRFLVDRLRLESGHRLLDLCCGPGRHLIPLDQHARLAVGLDLSQALLRRAKRNHRRLYGDCLVDRSCPVLLRGDMQHLPLADGCFDRIVNLFTSFGYFDDEGQNQQVLREIARVLRPTDSNRRGGLLAFDHINRSYLLKHFKARTRRTLEGGEYVEEHRQMTRNQQRVFKRILFTSPQGEHRLWHESVRVYDPDELETMMRRAGLTPIARYGDYDGSDWTPETRRLIIFARRRP